MVDHSTVVVLGIGIMVLTLTSKKTLILMSVKYVPLIFKNLYSRSLLYDAKMRLDFQGEKAVLSYKKTYFGYAYRTDGMHKISTTVSIIVINEISIFVYSTL